MSQSTEFNIPLDTKQVISGMLFPAKLLPSTEKNQTRRNNHRYYNKPRL